MNKEIGQYFTTNVDLQKKIYEFIYNNPKIILEPSAGKGHLINYIYSQNKNIDFDLYEIDNNLKLFDNLSHYKLNYADFLKVKINKKYITIVGNPPFVKIKKQKNLYIEFIEKCYSLLEENGELIFIIPSDFFKLTSSCRLLNDMLSNGTFTHLYYPNNENLFEKATIDICIFRYCKNKNLEKKVLYNNIEKSIKINDGIITFHNNELNDIVEDYFHVGVGMVSGKENVFKNDNYGNIELLNDEKDVKKYIYVENFPPEDENIKNYLLKNKDHLINRKIRKFDENNWFEWGALRNKKLIEKNLNKDCIYVRNLTRKSQVAFKGKVQYFGGKLLILIPKQSININNIINYLNNDIYKSNYTYSGRFKIGQKQLCKSTIKI